VSGEQGYLKGAIVLAAAVVVGLLLLSQSDGVLTTSTSKKSTTTTATTTATSPSVTVPTTKQGAAKPPSQVKVTVLNGSGQTGVAGTTTDTLKAAGYLTGTADNAPQTAPNTIVYFRPGYQADAEAVQTALGDIPSKVEPLPAQFSSQAVDVPTSNVIVVLGKDLPSG